MPDASLTPRIPPSHLPPAFVARRWWPMLDELHNNPFFLQRFYSRRPHLAQGLVQYTIIGIGCAGLLFAVFHLVQTGLHITFQGFLVTIVFLEALIMAHAFSQFRQFRVMLHASQPCQIEELWLMTTASVDIYWGVVGPQLSRRHYWTFVLMAGAAIACVDTALAGLGFSIPAVAVYSILLGALAWMCVGGFDHCSVCWLHRRLRDLHDFHSHPPGQRHNAIMNRITNFAGFASANAFVMIIIAVVAGGFFDMLDMSPGIGSRVRNLRAEILLGILLVIVCFSAYCIQWVLKRDSSKRYVESLHFIQCIMMNRLEHQR